MTAPNLDIAPLLTPFADADYPENPYPGARPDCSFVHVNGTGYPLRTDSGDPSGWRVVTGEGAEEGLDQWLLEHGVPPLSQRWPVLAYGSNPCPEKITWLRSHLGLTGPAVVIRARCTGLAAAWSSGVRSRDGQRPAVLVGAPGVVEDHAVWFATAEQRRVLDRCEARGKRYRLVRLDNSAGIRMENGAEPANVLAYAAAGREMAPLLVHGRPVLCTELDQHGARTLTGTPACDDGLSYTEIHGEPQPVLGERQA